MNHIIIFSFNRAFQLDGTLRSLKLNCCDLKKSKISILYKVTGFRNKVQYKLLKNQYPKINFIKEKLFAENLKSLISLSTYVTFIVDDCLFISTFYFSEIIESIKMNKLSIGFSLRLGRNTTFCYMMDKKQKLPEFTETLNMLKFKWHDSEYDFAYPLEVSSSTYKTGLIKNLLEKTFSNPNSLEAMFHENINLFRKKNPYLLCYKESKAFCLPMNKIQSIAKSNRSAISKKYSPKNLAKIFHKGFRIDVNKYQTFTPQSCHEESNLYMLKKEKIKFWKSITLFFKK